MPLSLFLRTGFYVIFALRPRTTVGAVTALAFSSMLLAAPVEAQVEQLLGIGSKVVPLLIMQGVKQYKKATDPAYAKAERERPKGKAEDEAFLDGDNFAEEWRQLGKQNQHIRLQEPPPEGDSDGVAQASKDKAARTKSKHTAKDDSDSDYDSDADADVKKVTVRPTKPTGPTAPREGSDWFMDEEDTSARKISAKVSKPKPAAEEAPAAEVATHSESVQGKILKSADEKSVAKTRALENSNTIMMPVSK